MLRLDKLFCCLPLRFGILIICAVDLASCAASVGVVTVVDGDEALFIVMLIIYLAHIMACIQLALSVYEQIGFLDVSYLITTPIRFLFVICLLIYQIISELHDIGMYVMNILTLIASVYFWICAYAWYSKIEQQNALTQWISKHTKSTEQ